MTDDCGKPISQRPKVRQILETAIYVQDVGCAAQFYDRVFGFPDLVRNERVVAYDAGNATVLLLFKRGATLVARRRDRGVQGARATGTEGDHPACTSGSKPWRE